MEVEVIIKMVFVLDGERKSAVSTGALVVSSQLFYQRNTCYVVGAVSDGFCLDSGRLLECKKNKCDDVTGRYKGYLINANHARTNEGPLIY